MKKSIIIGLTGPIASGKNTVAKIFVRHGAYEIDADKVGHGLLLPQTKVWHFIVRTFGAKVLKPGGRVNRKKLAHIVFSDKRLLNRLNKVMHPEMVKVIKQMTAASKKRIVLINAALLHEMKLISFVDKVVVVLAGIKKRIRRIQNSGKNMQDSLRRMRLQKPAGFYRKIADIVIMNNGNLKELKVRIMKVLIELLKTRH